MAEPVTPDAKPPLGWKRYSPDEVDPPTWLIEDLIPERATVGFYGIPNSGKTFLSLDWALAIATGLPAMNGFKKSKAEVGSEKTPGKVVFALAEGVMGLNRRIKGWMSHHGKTDKEGQDLLADRLFLPPGDFKFDSQADYDTLMRGIEANRCEDLSLLILDPLASYMTGDENSAQDMQKIVNAMRRATDRFGCSVLVVHHAGKSAWSSERGSSAFRGGVDTLLCLFEDPKTKALSLETDKQRDADKYRNIPLILHRIPDLGEDGTPLLNDDGSPRIISRIPIHDENRQRRTDAQHAAIEAAQKAALNPPEAADGTSATPRTDKRELRKADRVQKVLERIQEILNSPDKPADGFVRFKAIFSAFEHVTERGYKRAGIEDALKELIEAKVLAEGPIDNKQHTYALTGHPGKAEAPAGDVAAGQADSTKGGANPTTPPGEASDAP